MNELRNGNAQRNVTANEVDGSGTRQCDELVFDSQLTMTMENRPVEAIDGCSCSAEQEPIVLYDFRDFNVRGLNYGYNVSVGCHTFAIESKETLIRVLTEYINDPDAMEKKWWTEKTI